MVREFNGIPEWPKGLESHPLVVIDYDLIQKVDENEVDRLWKAATTLGFW
jgi:hypothetical protein